MHIVRDPQSESKQRLDVALEIEADALASIYALALARHERVPKTDEEQESTTYGQIDEITPGP